MLTLSLDALSAFQPNIAEVAARWDAFWQGEMIDRPVLLSSCPKPGAAYEGGDCYRARAFDPMEPQIERVLYNASQTYYGGDSIPSYFLSFAPDEIAAYCGAEILWPEPGSLETNWVRPFVDDWEKALPLSVDEDNVFYRRMQEFYRLCADRFAGRILTRTLDFHTNMDLLAAVRGSEALCMDLVDCPEAIDRAMEDVGRIFKQCWEVCTRAGRMEETGYYSDCFSASGSIGLLSCDFICLIGREMFRRWALPMMEYESSFFDHVMLHWDGPDALRHFDDMMAMKKLYLISYVPSPGETHLDYIDLYQKVQAAGKAVSVSGTTEQLQQLHRALNPAQTLFSHRSAGIEDTERMTEWLVKHT